MSRGLAYAVQGVCLALLLGLVGLLAGCRRPASDESTAESAKQPAAAQPSAPTAKTEDTAAKPPVATSAATEPPAQQTAQGADQPEEFVITFPGYKPGSAPSDVLYLVNGHAVGSGRAGFVDIVEQLADLPPGTSVVLPWIRPREPDRNDGGRPRLVQNTCDLPPYWEYEDLLKRVRQIEKDRKLDIRRTSGWETLYTVEHPWQYHWYRSQIED